MPHVSKKKHQKPYFVTHMVTVALSSSKTPGGRETAQAPDPQNDNKTLIKHPMQSNLWNISKTHFFRIKHLRPPSPKRPVAALF